MEREGRLREGESRGLGFWEVDLLYDVLVLRIDLVYWSNWELKLWLKR